MKATGGIDAVEGTHLLIKSGLHSRFFYVNSLRIKRVAYLLNLYLLSILDTPIMKTTLLFIVLLCAFSLSADAVVTPQKKYAMIRKDFEESLREKIRSIPASGTKSVKKQER